MAIARLNRALEHVAGKLVPAERERATEAARRLAEAGGRVPAADIARQEARQIHRVCRLGAKLKDPFLPLTLRDGFRLDNGVVNDRAKLLAELQAVEQAVPTIFQDIAVYAKIPSRRTYVRCSPYVLLSPACGFLGLSWNPRGGPEVGRLVVPGYCTCPGILQRMLLRLLSDFVWDTSRESAGLDVLTSDTLVAAYSKVRWDYRKAAKDTREKAGLYSEENDRVNWRRHFELYVSGAAEAGKRLFFKCPELYEAVVKYLPLPDGVEKLARQ